MRNNILAKANDDISFIVTPSKDGANSIFIY